MLRHTVLHPLIVQLLQRRVRIRPVAVQGLFVFPAEEVFGPGLGGSLGFRSGVAAGRSRGGALVFSGELVLVQGVFRQAAAPALYFLLCV